jgi:hypothetical protein
MINICILVCCHKESKVFRNLYISPIQLGAELHKEKNLFPLKDNMGKHISSKNKDYCELTAQYWAWKNIKPSVDYIGFFHYRRYLSFRKTFLFSKFINLLNGFYQYIYGWDARTVYKKINNSNADIILPKKFNIPFLYKGKKKEANLYIHLKDLHGEFIANKLAETIKKEYPEYESALNTAFASSDAYFKNMFIMKKYHFNKYMNFLFTTLFSLETELKKPEYKDYNSNRIYGFLAERLLNVFIINEQILNPNLRILELDLVNEFEFKFGKDFLKKQYGKLKSRLNMDYIKLIINKPFKRK